MIVNKTFKALALACGIAVVGFTGSNEACAETNGGPRLIAVERGKPAVSRPAVPARRQAGRPGAAIRSAPVGSTGDQDDGTLADLPEDSNDIKPEVLPARVKLAGFAADCAAALGGNGQAAYRMGRRYLFGMGVARSRNVGVAWMRKAASLGNPLARRVISLVPRRWGMAQPSCYGGGGGGDGGNRRFRMPPAEIIQMVNDIAPRYNLDPGLVMAVIQVESGGQPRAVSPKQASGLMQLIPETAQRFGVRNVFDPSENVHGGARYLRWLLAYFQGNVDLALAGYNAGEGAVDKYGGIPPYRETQLYVRWVRQLYKQDVHSYDPRVVAPSARFREQTADAANSRSARQDR